MSTRCDSSAVFFAQPLPGQESLEAKLEEKSLEIEVKLCHCNIIRVGKLIYHRYVRKN
jgi:hypothetical protein